MTTLVVASRGRIGCASLCACFPFDFWRNAAVITYPTVAWGYSMICISLTQTHTLLDIVDRSSYS